MPLRQWLLPLPEKDASDGGQWFLSPVDSAVPQVFAWYGFPQDDAPRLLFRRGAPVVWKGPTLDQARDAATIALETRDLSPTWAPEAAGAQAAFREAVSCLLPARPSVARSEALP